MVLFHVLFLAMGGVQVSGSLLWWVILVLFAFRQTLTDGLHAAVLASMGYAVLSVVPTRAHSPFARFPTHESSDTETERWGPTCGVPTDASAGEPPWLDVLFSLSSWLDGSLTD